MNPEHVIALIMALTGGDPAAEHFPELAAGGADDRYPVTLEPCPRPIGAAEIEGRTIICGTVEVPENHAEPDGRRIAIEFAIGRSPSLVPAPDPVVYLHGGPGYGTLDGLGATMGFFDALRHRRDIVTFDQRAAGLSLEAMTCFDVIVDNIVDIGIASLADDNDAQANAVAESLVAPCVEELRASGIQLEHYNTEQNALDVRAIMTALGYPEYNIYGVSYGTMLSLEVMRTAPEGVRSVVIDSVAPPDIALYDELAPPYEEVILAVFDQCAADAACNEAYPDLLNRFNALVDTLVEAPIPAARGLPPVDVGTLITLIVNLNDREAPRGVSGYLPLIIHELERGETTTIDAIASGALLGPTSPDEQLDPFRDILSDDELALAEIAMGLMQSRDGADAAIVRALGQLSDDLTADSQARDLPGLFDAALSDAFDAIATPARASALLVDYVGLLTGEQTRGALTAFVARNFFGQNHGRLQAMIGAMSDQQIAATFTMVREDTRGLDITLGHTIGLNIYACQEHMDNNSLEGFNEVNANLRIPILGAALQPLASIYEICEAFEQHPREGFHEPVVSDIRTLVLSGLNDIQTAASWGPHAAETLPNGRALVFPEAGHGALLFSQCAVDIGVAFIEDPSRPIDAGCIEDLTPEFALPTETSDE